MSTLLSQADALSFAAELERQATRDGVTKHVGAAVAVVNDGILLIRRLDSEPLLPSYWELPGGGREPTDDTLLDVLARELFEETGRPLVGIRKYLGYFDYSTSKHLKVRQWNFLVEVSPGPIMLSPSEHDRFQIVCGVDEITADLLISDESRKVLMEALRELSQPSLALV